MNTKLLILLMSASPMALAQQSDEVRIERIYTNTNAAMQNADAYDGIGEETQPTIQVIKKVETAPTIERVDALEDMKSANSANSPQVNIYNNNTNQNDNQNDNENVSATDQAIESSVAGKSALSQAYIQRANELRNARKDMEIGTEQKMIEKIEMSRLEDERRRADRLFGNRLNNNGYQAQQPVAQQPVQPQPTQQVIVVKEKAVSQEVKKEAVRLDDSASISTGFGSADWLGNETYIAPMAGVAEYGSAVNVDGGTAFGVSAGARYASGLVLEGTFLYSDYELEDFNTLSLSPCGLTSCAEKFDVTQYNFTVNAKYAAAIGRISPFVGAIAGFTYREYSGPDHLRNGQALSGDASSTAFDAGVNVGVDFKITRNISIGAEYRWMTNVSFSRDDNAQDNSISRRRFNPQTVGKDVKPLEEIDYQMFLINSKLTF